MFQHLIKYSLSLVIFRRVFIEIFNKYFKGQIMRHFNLNAHYQDILNYKKRKIFFCSKVIEILKIQKRVKNKNLRYFFENKF